MNAADAAGASAMSIMHCFIPILAAAGVVLGHPAFASARPVRLEQVLALEEADSLWGRYRIVFTISERFPPPSAMSAHPQLTLGSQPVRLPSDPRDQTLLFGYVDQLPSDPADFAIFSQPGAASDSAIRVDAQALLDESRPSHGEYEPGYVQRSVGKRPLNLAQAWRESQVVFVGRYVRGQTLGEERGMWSLLFETESLLSGNDPLPARIAIHTSTAPHELELGAKYILFARSAESHQRIVGPLQAVRLWWAHDDFVFDFLGDPAVRELLDAHDPASLPETLRTSLRELLMNALQSPAAEVRLTAAEQLGVLPERAMSAEERAVINDRIDSEPVPRVAESLRALLEQ